jgi:hypothetical protein
MAEVVTLLPPDAIPAILPDQVSEIMVTAEEVEAAGIDPAMRVIGVSINGESRAYPVPFMSAHEIVNDEVGGKLTAVPITYSFWFGWIDYHTESSVYEPSG